MPSLRFIFIFVYFNCFVAYGAEVYGVSLLIRVRLSVRCLINTRALERDTSSRIPKYNMPTMFA